MWKQPQMGDLGQLGAAEGDVASDGVQRADALLERQEALVDLRPLQPCLPVMPRTRYSTTREGFHGGRPNKGLNN